MRTPEAKIKEAILHPDAEIRLYAIGYYSEVYSPDKTVMPVVIQAVEKYGREATFEILHEAFRIPQTEATVDWAIGELRRRDYDPSDVVQENHAFVIARTLRSAPPPIFTRRFEEIVKAPAFPEALRQEFVDRLGTFAWDWERAWQALKYFGLDSRERHGTQRDFDWEHTVLEALARHRQQGERVLELLKGQYGGEDPYLMCWLRARIIDLAGEMRLTEAVPVLMDQLGEDHSCSAGKALERIGGDEVLDEIEARWRRGRRKFRRRTAEILRGLRGDRCAELALRFFRKEQDQETKLRLGEALLENYCEDAVDEIADFAVEIGAKVCRLHCDWDLRYRMVAGCMVMGRTFPQFGRWRRRALQDNWGHLDLPPDRVADFYKPPQVGPRWSEN